MNYILPVALGRVGRGSMTRLCRRGLTRCPIRKMCKWMRIRVARVRRLGRNSVARRR